jgi:hypothetical protein
MELVTSVMGGKAPRDGAALSIALGLQSGDALAQVLHTFHPTRQTPPGKNTDLDFGHIEPATMFGCVMELHSPQNPSGLSRRESFIQGRSGMRVQVILHDAHALVYWLLRTSVQDIGPVLPS